MTRVRRSRRASSVVAACVVVSSLALSACATTAALPQRDDGVVDVVATTPILTDLASHVAGDRARVTGLMPANADPHTYEPTLRDVRNIANADLALTNYMLLEEHSLIRAVEANVRPGVKVITLAEDAARYGAELIPLVENVSLDTIWLGMRVHGAGAQFGATRASEVKLSATDVRGPGQAAAFLTTTFGQPDIYFDSADGFNAADGYADDSVTLPVDAHTHVSWSFSEPGVYQVDFSAALHLTDSSRPISMGSTTVTFAVGVDPSSVPGMEGATILDQGHEDISVNLDDQRITIEGDAMTHEGGMTTDTHTEYDPAHTIIEVPGKALQQIPSEPAFRFLGRPGTETYLLPQAVLGKHVHGELDPHLWQNVANAIAYVKLIRDSLIAIDPEGARDYTDNAASYIDELNRVNDDVQAAINSIPESRRYLVTTHDGYAYLGKAYGIKIAGFVTPNPAIEPSARDLIALTRTLQNLKVPAVFLEPQLEGRANDLTELAGRLGIKVCRIYGDSFDTTVTNYVDMMEANAHELARCLSP